FENNSSYQAGSASLVERFSHGLIFKINYTFSKAMDMGSAYSNVQGSNEPYSILDPYNIQLDKGLAAFSMQQQFNANFSYELPFGRGQRWVSGAGGFM